MSVPLTRGTAHTKRSKPFATRFSCIIITTHITNSALVNTMHLGWWVVGQGLVPVIYHYFVDRNTIVSVVSFLTSKPIIPVP